MDFFVKNRMVQLNIIPFAVLSWRYKPPTKYIQCYKFSMRSQNAWFPRRVRSANSRLFAPPPRLLVLFARWMGICMLDVILKKTDFVWISLALPMVHLTKQDSESVLRKLIIEIFNLSQYLKA